MKYIIFTCFCYLTFFDATAFSDTTNIPLNRKKRHDDIRNEQRSIDKMDGKEDGMLRVGADENITNQVTDALFRKPNELRQWIETNDVQLSSNNEKVRYLRNISEVLLYFRISKKDNEITFTQLPALLTAFEKIMKAKVSGKSILILRTNGCPPTFPLSRIVPFAPFV